MTYHFPYAVRFNSFKTQAGAAAWKRGEGDLRAVLERMDGIAGLSGTYLNFPEHFTGSGNQVSSRLFADTGIKCSGLNIRFPDPAFVLGDFSNPSAELRAQAVDLCKRAVDACRELGAGELIIWPAHDGVDYPLQADYETMWNHELEGLAAVAAYAPDLRLSVEFKPSEPRRRSLLDSTATTLLAIRQLGFQNLGLTLDYCHVLMAKEQPAMSAMHCLKEGKLFGMHLNDGHGCLDDGLAIGTVTPIETLELVHYLTQYRFDGVIYFDTFPVGADPVAECALNIAQMERFCRLLEHADQDRLKTLRSEHDAIGIARLLAELQA